MEIKGKVIIITGASQGIGLAAARHLAEKGAKVVLAARSKEIIQNLEKDLKDSLAVVTDMRNEKDVKKLVSQTIKKYGRVDILINNAGQGTYGLVENIDLDSFRQIMELNVFSVVSAMKEVIPHMRKQGGGMIVNISSGVSKNYFEEVSAYSSTKYALNAISLIARKELAEDNIIVSLVHPKLTATNFSKNAIGTRPAWALEMMKRKSIDSPELVAQKIAEIINSEEAEIII